MDDTMRVLTSGNCDTLSGSSRLTYHIGCLPGGEIHIRVHSNTGGGFFSQEWISLQDRLTALKKRPDWKPIMSILLNPLFRGRSPNESRDRIFVPSYVTAKRHSARASILCR